MNRNVTNKLVLYHPYAYCQLVLTAYLPFPHSLLHVWHQIAEIKGWMFLVAMSVGCFGIVWKAFSCATLPWGMLYASLCTSFILFPIQCGTVVH